MENRNLRLDKFDSSSCAANLILLFLAGDFDDWSPDSLPMKRQSDGAWFVESSLNHGHNNYRVIVDGKSIYDLKAQGTARDHQWQKVSLVEAARRKRHWSKSEPKNAGACGVVSNVSPIVTAAWNGLRALVFAKSPTSWRLEK